MPDLSFAIVIASLHGHTGKTLLARVMADYFALSGEKPYLFDTDPFDRRLHTQFPQDARVVDLAQVSHQMALFDALARASRESRIVDLTHRSCRTFFDLMRDTDFIAEARARRVEPIIVYIPDRKRDSFEAGFELRMRFPDCAFVVVDNAFLGKPRDNTRFGDAYRALAGHDHRLRMPALDPTITDALDEPLLSLSEFMRRPLSHGSRLPDDLVHARSELRSWLVTVFQDIYRITSQVREQAVMTAALDARQAPRLTEKAPPL